VLLFVAPTLSGDGPRAFEAAVGSPRTLARLRTRQVGADVLLEAYVHDP
jgi:riboflavin biosynthesis pyrimidine reductase